MTLFTVIIKQWQMVEGAELKFELKFVYCSMYKNTNFNQKLIFLVQGKIILIAEIFQNFVEIC